MPVPSLPHRRSPVVLCVAFAVAHACAHAAGPTRAVFEPVGGVQMSYERLGPGDSASPPGRFEGALATPAGTFRTSVNAEPSADQPFRRGDTSFEWANTVFGGKVQLRELQAGGTTATWRGRLDGRLTVETVSEWTPARNAQTLRLNRSFGEFGAAKAVLSSSQDADGQPGARGAFEFTQDVGRMRWNAGVDTADAGYVSADGAPSGTSVRLGAQWRFLDHTRLVAGYTRQLAGDAGEGASSLMLGTRFDLPRRASLVTSVETHSDDYAASVKLVVPLVLR